MTKKQQEDLPDIIHHKVRQHLKATKKKRGSLFFGLGLFGTIGWTIAIPTLLGTLLGRKLDSLYHGQISWTITCMLTGMAIGCLVAWRWLTKEGGEK